MPHQEHSHRFQKAVLWSKVFSNRYGEVVVDDPEEIQVRWDPTEREVTRPDGTPIRVDAELFTNRAIVVGSVLWLGRLTDWYGTGSSDEPVLMQVVTYDETPDIKNRVKAHRVSLQKHGGDLPQVAAAYFASAYFASAYYAEGYYR